MCQTRMIPTGLRVSRRRACSAGCGVASRVPHWLCPGVDHSSRSPQWAQYRACVWLTRRHRGQGVSVPRSGVSVRSGWRQTAQAITAAAPSSPSSTSPPRSGGPTKKKAKQNIPVLRAHYIAPFAAASGDNSSGGLCWPGAHHSPDWRVPGAASGDQQTRLGVPAQNAYCSLPST